MGFILNRAYAILDYSAELMRYGVREVVGDMDHEVVFALDGIGGTQIAPLMMRRALRQTNAPIGSILFDWHCKPRCEPFRDLMWLRRNRVMGAKLARRLLAFRRAHPATRIHLSAFSGGAGIAVFACEHLTDKGVVDTLLLGCPALSPSYNLAPALRAVRRCYSLNSHRDRFLLGIGTTIFGTTDRRFGSAAGRLGFSVPPGAGPADLRMYERLGQIQWISSLRADKHYGGHTGWVSTAFLRRHLVPILHGEPLLPVHRGAIARDEPGENRHGGEPSR